MFNQIRTLLFIGRAGCGSQDFNIIYIQWHVRVGIAVQNKYLNRY